MIDKNIETACIALNIDKPTVVRKKKLHTDTQLAEFRPDENVICIKDIADDMNLVFAVVHELRHAWQFKNTPDMFKNYQNSAVLSVKAYNLQPAEVDANAYTVIYFGCLYGIRPTFNALGVEVCEAIEKRANEIRSGCEAALAEALDIK